MSSQLPDEQANYLHDSKSAVPELQHLCKAMPARLKSKFPEISYADAEDITATAVLRMLQQYQNNAMIDEPTAYFYKVANNLAAEWFRDRARRKESSLPNSSIADLPMLDDQAAAAFNSVSTAADIKRVLGHILEDDDVTLFRIFTYMLDHFYRTGKGPSHRQAGEACGLSHTGVAKALVRLRRYFPDTRTSGV